MANFNRVILAGNLTRDPELKYLPNNTPVCEFGMAINHRWRDREGNQREDVCFVDVSAFGRQAETINQYMSKGRPLLVEGRLKFDSWTGKDGAKRSRLSVVAENFQFLGSGQGGGGGGGRPESGARDSGGQGGGYTRGAPAGGGPDDYGAPPNDGPPPSGDDIPF